MAAVLVGQDRFLETGWPFNAESWIIPQQAAVVCRRIIGANLVEHFGIRLERAEAVREAGRHEDLRPVLGADQRGDVAAEGRRAVTQIDGDVDDRAARY